MRIAVFTPVPPQRTGIADYSALLLPALAKRHEIEVFAEGPDAPLGSEMRGMPIRRVGEFSRQHRDRSYDRILYQIGNNSAFHRESYSLLRTTPGIVLLHEVMIHHLVREEAVSRGGTVAYGETLQACYGETGRGVAEEISLRGLTPFLWRLALFEEAVDRSLGVVVHNEASRRRILASRPLSWIEVLPLPVAVPGPAATPEERRRLREELGWPPDAVVVGTFGYLTAQKRIEPLLGAFARLRAVEPKARLLLAGAVSGDYDLATLLAGERGQGVASLGRVEAGRFRELMASTDVAVNLRYPSGGETSATLMQLMALGRAVIVSDHGSFAELPEGCVAKVPVEDAEEETLFAYLEALVGDDELRGGMGKAARQYVLQRCDLARVAAQWNRIFDELPARGREPVAPVPPIAPYPTADVSTALLADLARFASDLGAAEDDPEILPHLAEVLVELGIDPGS